MKVCSFQTIHQASSTSLDVTKWSYFSEYAANPYDISTHLLTDQIILIEFGLRSSRKCCSNFHPSFIFIGGPLTSRRTLCLSQSCQVPTQVEQWGVVPPTSAPARTSSSSLMLLVKGGMKIFSRLWALSPVGQAGSLLSRGGQTSGE